MAAVVSTVLLQVLSLGSGFPNGAPVSACEDMVPRHAGTQPHPSPVPYTIQTSSRTFQSGQPITVAIRGLEYRGVLLEAHSGSSTNAIGNWQLPPADTKFLECSGNARGAITNANTNVKGNSTVYTWIPLSTTSSVYFMATVAQQRTVYWFNIRSETLTRGAAGGIGLAASGISGMAATQVLLLLSPGLLVTQVLHS